VASSKRGNLANSKWNFLAATKNKYEKRLSAIVFATVVVRWVVKVPDIKVKALKLYAI